MKPEEIHLGDLNRILIGEIPASFFVELLLRALLIYVLLIVSMRLMGKRMATQIGRNEMAAVTSLAAAVGIPLMNPDRGILPPIIIAGVIIFFQRIISTATVKNQWFESLTQDDLSILVRDGVMDLKKMKKTRISRDRLFAQLRAMGLMTLGEVDRLYLESNGLYSLVPRKEKQRGISVIPPWDDEFKAKLKVSDVDCGCYECGKLHPKAFQNTPLRCENCGASRWTDVLGYSDR
ncbi:DUF421 domain-containing protein [Pedobacter sp.]|uniref:DUF421 domain-containing protein n=1 Tax=Pedobacter sp. TaxID=1411316 RepID=UPI003D7F454A